MWSAATAGPPDFSNVSYADFQHQYGREPYALLGGLNREALFEENKKKVLAQNVKYAAGESTWWAAINEYADWTDTEFASQKTSRSPILGNLKASGRALVEERANNPFAFHHDTREEPGLLRLMLGLREHCRARKPLCTVCQVQGPTRPRTANARQLRPQQSPLRRHRRLRGLDPGARVQRKEIAVEPLPCALLTHR